MVLVQGRYLSFLPLCSRNEPVFLATCTPVAMPETRECVVQGATNVFTSIHSMDMRFIHIDAKYVSNTESSRNWTVQKYPPPPLRFPQSTLRPSFSSIKLDGIATQVKSHSVISPGRCHRGFFPSVPAYSAYMLTLVIDKNLPPYLGAARLCSTRT